jgi:hypothetical protein
MQRLLENLSLMFVRALIEPASGSPSHVWRTLSGKAFSCFSLIVKLSAALACMLALNSYTNAGEAWVQ